MRKSEQQEQAGNRNTHLTQRGFKPLELMAFETDRDLLLTLARRLSENGPGADQTRAAVKALVGERGPGTGEILASLRRSPLVGADLDLSRIHHTGRRVDF